MCRTPTRLIVTLHALVDTDQVHEATDGLGESMRQAWPFVIDWAFAGPDVPRVTVDPGYEEGQFVEALPYYEPISDDAVDDEAPDPDAPGMPEPIADPDAIIAELEAEIEAWRTSYAECDGEVRDADARHGIACLKGALAMVRAQAGGATPAEPADDCGARADR